MLAGSYKLVVFKAINSYVRTLKLFWKKMLRTVKAEDSEDKKIGIQAGTKTEQSL